MWQIATGVVLALGVVTGLMFYENRSMVEDLQKQRSTIADLKYDLFSWEQAGQFWEKQNTVQQRLVVEREQRNSQLNAENDDLKEQLRGISDEADPCLNHVVSDDVLGVLWDDATKTTSQLHNTDGDINSADTGANTTSTR